MGNELEIIRQIEVLESRGRELRPQDLSSSPETYELDSDAFHRWRVEVSKLLFSTLGSSNYYYQCFWKTVGKPSVKSVDEGLRLLAQVRHELEDVFPRNALFCPVPDRPAVDGPSHDR